MRDIDDITAAIVDASLQIHRAIGPRLFESVYEALLAHVLARRGFRVDRQHPIGFEYEGLVFDEAFRADILVDGRVIVEVKSIERIAAVHRKQVLTYLRLADLRVGLLINFGAATLREGLHRIVNDLQPSASSRLRVNRQAASRTQ